jgi:hypothetical protein
MPSVNSEVPVCGNSAPVGARAPVGRRCRLGRRAKTVASRQRLLLRRRRGRGGCVYGAGDAVDDMSSTSRRARKPTTTNRRSRQARSSARGRCARARTQRCQPSEDSSCSQACLWRARSRARRSSRWASVRPRFALAISGRPFLPERRPARRLCALLRSPPRCDNLGRSGAVPVPSHPVQYGEDLLARRSPWTRGWRCSSADASGWTRCAVVPLEEAV